MKRRQFLSNLSKGVMIGPLAGLTPLHALKPDKEFHLLHKKIAKIISAKWNTKQTLTILYPKGSIANLLPVVRLFKKMTGVNILLKEGSLDAISSELLIKNRINNKKDTIDVALPATFSIPDLVEAKAITPLTHFQKKYEPRGFHQSSLYTAGDSYQSNFYGHQADGDTYLMFYNQNWLNDSLYKSRFEKKYKRELALPKTWQELDLLIEFFHAPKENRFGANLYRNKNYIVWEFWLRLHAKGTFPVDDNMQPLFHKKSGIQALDELIRTSQYLAPNCNTNSLFENITSYAKGNTFCNIGWGGTQKLIKKENPKLINELTYSLPPGGATKPIAFFNWGWNYVVTTQSSQKELAYLFTLFASTPTVSTMAIQQEEGYFDPFRVEHYQDKKIKNIYSPSFLRVHQKAMQNNIPDFYLRGQSLYLTALKEAVYAANLGQIPTSVALKKAADNWNRITDRLGRAEQIKSWKKIKKLYPPQLTRKMSS